MVRVSVLADALQSMGECRGAGGGEGEGEGVGAAGEAGGAAEVQEDAEKFSRRRELDDEHRTEPI